MCVLHLNTGTLGHVHTTKKTRVKLRGVRLVKQTCVLWAMGDIKSQWIWRICITFRNFFEHFEGDSAETCAGKFPLMSMGGWAEGLACADPGVRTPIGVSGIVYFFFPKIFSVKISLSNSCCMVSELLDCSNILSVIISYIVSVRHEISNSNL